jgi:hypothetical protein
VVAADRVRLAVLVFLVAAAVGINAGFGLNPTLATLFGVSGYDPLELPEVGPTTDVPSVPLAQSFVPPAGMPTKGSRGTQVIPATASGFAAPRGHLSSPPRSFRTRRPCRWSS